MLTTIKSLRPTVSEILLDFEKNGFKPSYKEVIKACKNRGIPIKENRIHHTYLGTLYFGVYEDSIRRIYISVRKNV